MLYLNSLRITLLTGIRYTIYQTIVCLANLEWSSKMYIFASYTSYEEGMCIPILISEAIDPALPSVIHWLFSQLIHLSPYCDDTAGVFNISRPRQNVRHFSDDNFKCTFLNDNICISTEISLKSDTTGPINNIPALFQIMAWRRPAFIWTNDRLFTDAC